jgi:uncharacterized protein YpbB
MVQLFTRNIAWIIYLLLPTFVSALMIPTTVMAESATLSCQAVSTQIEHTRSVLLPLEQRRQQIQQHVRTIYQELFACQTGISLTQAQQENCRHLQDEGPKQFQAMVKAITLSHQTSQQLARQTRQAKITCPAIAAEGTFPKTISLAPLQDIAKNK